MSFTKDSLDIASHSIMSQHLVCVDSYCPRTTDPFTNRVICRCYQTATTTPGHLPMSANMAAVLYHTTIQGELPSPVTSPMQSSHGMRWDNTTIPTMGMGSPFPVLSPAPQNIDNILRSQMYSYMHSGMDPNNGRRKNATRETTAALKAWLKEHRKNPYPTKAEKIMLAIITRMTLTQVSTWFANARRRLKKENKGEFSSDISFDNISTSSDDEDNTKPEALFKTERIFNTETTTPEHELPGFSGINSDIYNYASFSFHSSRPLTSTPIDHNMNNLPEYPREESKMKVLNDNSKRSGGSENNENDNNEKIKNSSDRQNLNNEDSEKTSDSNDKIISEKNCNVKDITPTRPRFLPPLISKPKIWSISNIIGNDTKEEEDSTDKKC